MKGAEPGKIFYGMMCYENGGTVDDLLVYKMAENDFFLVINAANIDKDVEWMKSHLEGYDVEFANRSDYYGQLAVQGPEAEAVVEEVLGLACKDLVFYTSKTIDVDGETIIISRTGYTGEDGFEIYASHDFIIKQWDKLIESGRCKPCGLGCRDTLRFEMLRAEMMRALVYVPAAVGANVTFTTFFEAFISMVLFTRNAPGL